MPFLGLARGSTDRPDLLLVNEQRSLFDRFPVDADSEPGSFRGVDVAPGIGSDDVDRAVLEGGIGNRLRCSLHTQTLVGPLTACKNIVYKITIPFGAIDGGAPRMECNADPRVRC